MSQFGYFFANHLDYSALKILHFLGLILFIGNIIVTGWWKVMADRTGDPRVVAFAQRQVTLTDWVFTFGGVIIAAIGAFGMVAHLSDDIYAEIHSRRWLRWGFYLFVLSGVIWVVVLIPCQIVQARMARGFASSDVIPQRYWFYGRIWLWAGIIATVIPLANLYWMVMKP